MAMTCRAWLGHLSLVGGVWEVGGGVRGGARENI